VSIPANRTKVRKLRAEFEDWALPIAPALYRTAHRLSRRPEDARDLVQETYLRAYRTFGNFQPGTNVRAWLFTILYSILNNESALRSLPEEYRAAILLVDVEDLSYEEAAEILSCPVGTLRSRLHRARKLLFAALRDYAVRNRMAEG
jgi:RNA polymerase sigma-70 factor (ECF subfamily)